MVGLNYSEEAVFKWVLIIAFAGGSGGRADAAGTTPLVGALLLGSSAIVGGVYTYRWAREWGEIPRPS